MPSIANAIQDFHRARRRASLEQIFARLTGRSADLLSYEEVRHSLRANQQIERGLQDVPLDAIIGSAGRYKDFTRSFLPKDSISSSRWANVKTQNLTESGLPPIELYQIGDAYFVLDGNHRVSVAREMGLPSIQAYVTEVLSRVPLTPDTEPDDLIIAEQYLDFLEKTRLDELRPESNLRVTAPGKYPLLLEHIEVHRYFMGLDLQQDVSWEEAVTHWYDRVYLPVIDMIRKRGILREFPDRTETDFYIWLAEHRAELEASLGWDLTTREAVEALADEATPLISRMSDYLFDGAEQLEPAPRQKIEKANGKSEEGPLFSEILVSVGENEVSWAALEQAARFAQKERGHLRGLHFTPSYEAHEHDPEVHRQFEDILNQYQIGGRLADSSGDWARIISDRARWSDLLVLGIQQPPDGTILTRLTAEWRQVLQNSPRPVMAVPRRAMPLNKALVAYDGGRRSQEALFVAACLCGRWQIPMTAIAVGEKKFQDKMKLEIEDYLSDMGLNFEFVGATGDVANNILVTLESHACDFLIMGGYGNNLFREFFIGSTVEHVLRNSWLPVLICQ